MKIITKIILLALIATLFSSNTVAAQYARTVNYNTSTSNSSTLMLSVIKTKMAMDGYTLASDDYFTIQENEIKIRNRTFLSGNDYVIIVLPTEDGVNDLDLYMCDSYGNILLKDDDRENSAMINHSPSRYHDAVLKVKNQDSNRLSYGYDAHLLIFFK
jgi:hypothetical protein